MPLFDDAWKYAHIPTLHAINEQLQTPEAALEQRFMCLGFAEHLNGRCRESAQGFPAYRVIMMRKTSKALRKTEVSPEDFVAIVRSMFCGYHDRQPKKKHCREILQHIWRNADAEAKTIFMREIAQGHKDIFRYYARLEGCHADDVEDAIKTEDPVPEVNNDSQIIAHEPKQHPLLSRVRELVGMQAMYPEAQADDRKSSNVPDATISGASGSAIPTRSRVETNPVNHPTDYPFNFDFQPRASTASKVLEPVLVNKRASPSPNDYRNRSVDVAPPKSTSKEASGPTIKPFDRALENSKSVSGRTTPKLFIPEISENSHGGPSFHPTPPLVHLGDSRVEEDLEKTGMGRDTRSHTPESTTSGLRFGQRSSAQVSAEDTPTPLAKKAGLPGMRQTLSPGSHLRESPNPAQPSPAPTNHNQSSTRFARSIEAVTPPTQRRVSTPNNTPRNQTRWQAGPGAIARGIRKILREPIDYSNDGYIYVLKAPRFFDQFPPSRDRAEPEQWVKIGITRNIEDRMGKLIGSCGITDLDVCKHGLRGPEPMPMLHRVEKLCHAELANFQRPLDCNQTGTRCDTVHREWFNVTEEVAIRTVKRWLRFFSMNPYTNTGALKSGFWDDRVYNGEYLNTLEDEDVDRTHERYQSWLETSIQQYETKIAEEKLEKLSVGSRVPVQ
ncbi:hypothetical protein P171DRAFT_429141 [Karstenula rhodostoma CBS 690.94]|uniref:Bacteriophage T5 Orf172 DNA-binding domain-containing protein n=1 Tax=Karstenula rhodostoma CBS 690.94 TaxID=1392251 RepID=A0A9P4PP09_9PLEO|nr:hypothetical protein P171DRAFT_429141 [Karstenula rhodostoma CBS 690.94]